MKYINKYFKLITSILVSIVLTVVVGALFLEGQTPYVRSNWNQNLASNITGSFLSLINKGSGDQIENKLKDVPLIQIGKGVYAKEAGGYSQITVIANEAEWEEIAVTNKCGVSKVLQFPKIMPPIKEMLDTIKNESCK